jgi:hypothetical protein
MKKYIFIILVLLSQQGLAESLNCSNSEREFTIDILKNQNRIALMDHSSGFVIDFRIYQTSKSESGVAVVTTYKVKDGTDGAGQSLSGEFATFSVDGDVSKVRVHLLNDSQSKTVINIESMECISL